MFECTCIICGATFKIDQSYDVCSMICEGKRWELDEKRDNDSKGYIPKRDDRKVKPRRI